MVGTKDTIERLAREWNWTAVSNDPVKRKLLFQPMVDVGIQVPVPIPGGGYRDFSFRHRKEDGDLRIWTKTMAGLIQWRTNTKKGSRLVYRPFGKGSTTERVDIEDIFMDPEDVDVQEVVMFEMIYSELVPLIPQFYEALSLAEETLGRSKVKGGSR